MAASSPLHELRDGDHHDPSAAERLGGSLPPSSIAAAIADVRALQPKESPSSHSRLRWEATPPTGGTSWVEDADPLLVFQCAACGGILGDSLSLMAVRKDLKMAVVSSVTEDVVLSRELVTSKEAGPDLGSTYAPISCGSCKADIGKVYKTTPAALDDLRDTYSLALDDVSIYRLGSTRRDGRLPQVSLQERRNDFGTKTLPGDLTSRQQQQRQSLHAQDSTATSHLQRKELGSPTRRHEDEQVGIHDGRTFNNGRALGPIGRLSEGTPAPVPGRCSSEVRKMQLLIMSIGERLLKLEKRVYEGSTEEVNEPPSAAERFVGSGEPTPAAPAHESPVETEPDSYQARGSELRRVVGEEEQGGLSPRRGMAGNAVATPSKQSPGRPPSVHQLAPSATPNITGPIGTSSLCRTTVPLTRPIGVDTLASARPPSWPADNGGLRTECLYPAPTLAHSRVRQQLRQVEASHCAESCDGLDEDNQAEIADEAQAETAVAVESVPSIIRSASMGPAQRGRKRKAVIARLAGEL